MSSAAEARQGDNGARAPWFAFLESNTTGTGREFCAAARARGLRPVLLTRDPARYPYVAQDGIETRLLDTSDLPAVLEACAALAADGGLAGVASSSEYFVAAAAHAAAQAGLPAADGDAIARCRAKDVQRTVLRDAEVPVPAFEAVDDVADALGAAEALGHPVVLKPVSGSGSVGVRLCRDMAETRTWATELLRRGTDERGNPVPTRFLVEEAVRGPEFSVETFDGSVVAVVSKHLGSEPYFVETGHDVPAPVTPPIEAALAETALSALSALGLGWGAAHTELRLGPQGPVVIEVNPRLAGGMIPLALRTAFGVDLVDASVARACGQEPAPRTPGAGHAAVRFLCTRRAGRVTAVHGLREAAAAPGVAALTTTTVGRDVRVTHSFQDRLGCVVASGPDPGTASARALTALRMIDIRLDGTGAAADAERPTGTTLRRPPIGNTPHQGVGHQ
ncbi:ATP-grasp domain-containing protein [Streptomyces massasporeus]|uniref:ATP-grasp domain-containing protein n=1 Tax=Streptomyces massasporeus TaxID=67324 RepID=UPI0036E23402